eukprot:2194528-Pyramimonas_sp.AAC.1
METTLYREVGGCPQLPEVVVVQKANAAFRDGLSGNSEHSHCRGGKGLEPQTSCAGQPLRERGRGT